ncbi:MAG: SpoIIE family protein phosphatase [Deltaproteobacteria bacterium]|nr:SpoIIE family protein phosphatase [Deltaproteobacteria bacterium]
MNFPDHGASDQATQLTQHGIQVLLIDDQAIIAEAVRRMLHQEPDIRFHYCQDPAQAIQTACDIHPTVILLDLIMPEIDGLTLAKFLRANKLTREIPLIVLSSKEEAVTKAEAFAAGANDYLVKLPDKIELIARIRYHSNAYIMRLQRNEAYEALVASQKALTNELSQASEYVRSLLPHQLTGDIRTDWEFIPSTSLGGDSFGYHWIDDDHFAIYLLDVCGHGVGAALLSISALNTLRSESLNYVDFRDPSQVLEGLNEVYQMEAHHEMFFTIWYGVFNRERRDLIFASGGHPPAIARTGMSSQTAETVALNLGGLIIGGLPGQKYQKSTLVLEPYARLYIYSDGIYEVSRPEGGMVQLNDFIELVGNLSREGDGSPKTIINAMRRIQNKEMFEDDVSLLEVEFL